MEKKQKRRILWINLWKDDDTYFKFRFLQGFFNARSAKETLMILINYFLEKEGLRERVERLREEVLERKRSQGVNQEILDEEDEEYVF